jgi:hypothetical protein
MYIHNYVYIHVISKGTTLMCWDFLWGGYMYIHILYAYIHLYVCTYIHIGLHVYMYTYTCVYIYIYIRVYTNESSEVHEPKTVSGSVDSIKVSSDKM